MPNDVQGFLDDVFERAVRRVEDGLTPDVDSLIAGHETLRGDVERLVRLAEQVAVASPRRLPALRGFTVLHELGRGGMGAVYLARQESLGGRPVALKVLPAGSEVSARARERFLTEARALAKLHHRHIVAVHEVIQDDGACAYAMEWVDGISLATLIDRLAIRASQLGTRSGHRGLSTMDHIRAELGDERGLLRDHTPILFLARLGRDIAKALSVVHQAGLLHRDVKPSNLLLRRDGTPLLADFGLVRDAESSLHTREGSFAGTVAYAPPEQLRGQGDALDARSDLYALGVTLFHALALRLPFEPRDPAAMLRSIEHGIVTPMRKLNPRVPRDLETIVSKAMEAQPERRYQTADEMADDLDRLLSLQPIKARPAGPLTRTIKLLRRHRGRVIGALVGAILAAFMCVGVGLYWFVVPKWLEGHLADARLTLLDPTQGNQLYAALFLDDRGFVTPAAPPRALQSALAAYDQAARLAPFDGEIRVERDVVRRALEIGTPTRPVDYASVTDLRLQGMLAILVGDVPKAIEAWSRLDLERDPDAFVEAALGILYLAGGEPGRAYPRLRHACRSYPDVGYLTVYLADAALQCGDLDKARQWLEAARTMPRSDPYGGWHRVHADWLVAVGRDDEAAAAYERILSTSGEALSGVSPASNPVAAYRYARLLDRRGRLEEAVRYYMRAGGRFVVSGRLRRELASCADRWWAALPRPARYGRVLATLDDPEGPASLIPVMRCCGTGQALAAGPAIGSRQVSQESAPLLPGKTSPSFGDGSFGALAQRMEITNMDIWSVIPCCPKLLRCEQARIWLATSPGRIRQVLLDASIRAWRSADRLVRHRRLPRWDCEAPNFPLRRWRAACATVTAILALVATPAGTESMTYADGTFHPLDWRTNVASSTGNGGLVSVLQERPEDGAETFRMVEHFVVPATTTKSSSVASFHGWMVDTYHPAVQGAIDVIDFSVDYIMMQPPFPNAAQAFHPALRQDGVVYVAESWNSAGLSWQTHSKSGLRQAHWTDLTTGQRHPDFSRRGSPIEFGFLCANGARGNGYAIQAGYDNWRVVIHRARN